MRRWNGWGDESVVYPLSQPAATKLEAWVGSASPPRDATLAEVLESVPGSRLPPHRLVTCDPVARLRHARGQSLPDWIALRSGLLGAFPDGVAYPADDDEVRELIRWAQTHQIVAIPYGGGTSVVGHINPPADERPVLTIALERLCRLRQLDKVSHLATFEAGVRGPDLEAALRANGFTMGHFPQSFEYSTLGGWIATRSTGQQSLRYGKIERTFAGGNLESPVGPLSITPVPATAAGPDLRELVLGSEGRLGILTEATLRISPIPEHEAFHTVFFPDFASGCHAIQDLVRARIPLSMLRLSTAVETATNLALAGHERLVKALETGLSFLGKGEQKAMLMLGLCGDRSLVRFSRDRALHVARQYGALHAGRYMGSKWHKTRFTTPYLRNTLWEMGYAVDTLETAAPWSRVHDLLAAVEKALRTELEADGERVHVFSHISNVYTDGSSLYTSYLYRLQPDPETNLHYWKRLKAAASQAIMQHGGTISHQHGVGIDHRPYLITEKGALGIEALQAVSRLMDPESILNPGKLL